jgi:retron-type reverse transcriptase
MGVNLGPFERICSIHQLELVFRVVKRKGRTPGIDGVTIESFEKNLLEEITRLNEEVESWSYQPSL